MAVGKLGMTVGELGMTVGGVRNDGGATGDGSGDDGGGTLGIIGKHFCGIGYWKIELSAFLWNNWQDCS